MNGTFAVLTRRSPSSILPYQARPLKQHEMGECQDEILFVAATISLQLRSFDLSRRQTALLNTAAKANLRGLEYSQAIWRAPRTILLRN
jgi:hypothetical protein